MRREDMEQLLAGPFRLLEYRLSRDPPLSTSTYEARHPKKDSSRALREPDVGRTSFPQSVRADRTA